MKLSLRSLAFHIRNSGFVPSFFLILDYLGCVDAFANLTDVAPFAHARAMCPCEVFANAVHFAQNFQVCRFLCGMVLNHQWP